MRAITAPAPRHPPLAQCAIIVTMRTVLVLRPPPGNRATCVAAAALGLDAVAAPLFAYTRRDWQLPDPVPRYHGILAGSMAVFAHGGDALTGLRAIPVHAVGTTTADAARRAGFGVGHIGSGGLQAVAGRLTPGRYLRLAGEARVALTPPPGVTIDDVVVYAAQALPVAPATLALVRRGPVLVLLHSAEAARHWHAQCVAHGLNIGDIVLACLGPRIATAAGHGWAKIGVAQNPDDQALLSLAVQMCETV